MNFKEIYQKYHNELERIAYRTGELPAYLDRADLVEEMVVHLWQEWRKGHLKDKTESYILQGCWFHLRNYLRLNQGKKNICSLSTPLEESETGAENFLSDLIEDDFSWDTLENRLTVETILNDGLTPREKDVFILALEGLTMREIGSKLGVSPARVCKLQQNIRHKWAPKMQ